MDTRILWDDTPVELNAAPGGVVSPWLFGTNLEHTRSCVFSGISAQMLRNRKFAGKPACRRGNAMEWFPIGETTYLMLEEPYTRHSEEGYHMTRRLECNSQRIMNLDPGAWGGIGQHGLYFEAGRRYLFAVVARTEKPTEVRAALTSHRGEKTYGEITFPVEGTEWKRYEFVLTPDSSDDDGDLRILRGGSGSLFIGAVSLMPEDNFHGLRRDVVARLKELGTGILRWPGGNFAGEYCWFDGLMPVDMRAPLESFMGLETQPHSAGYDYHEMNTDDFIALCREIGAEPFITINAAWNTPEENAAWVEYCNGDKSTKYGALRCARGHEEPYNVRVWSLGNEAGYGHMEGDNTPEGYAEIAEKNARAMLRVSPELCLCASGPYPNAEWAEKCAKSIRSLAPLASVHLEGGEPCFREPENYEQEYYEKCVDSVECYREYIRTSRAQFGEGLGISFDEWNLWYAWYRPSCTAEGIFAGLTQNMFLSMAEQYDVRTACFFEAVNEGFINVYPDRAELTASGQVMALMKGHEGGALLYASPFAVATRKGDRVLLTAVNPDFREEHILCIAGEYTPEAGTLFSCDSLMPYTRFTETDILPIDGKLVLPPHSAVSVTLHI